MACKFHPIAPTETIPYPNEWCNIRWGYCQWEKDCAYNVYGCPLAGQYEDGDWFTYWINSQCDNSMVVTLELNDNGAIRLETMTVGEFKKLSENPPLNPDGTKKFTFTKLQVEPITIVKPDDLPCTVTLEQKLGLIGSFQEDYGSVTIYDADGHLISLGRKAFYGKENVSGLTSLKLPFCLHVGDFAFQGCDSLKEIDFSTYKYIDDGMVPVLDSPNAFITTGGKLNKNIKIYVPLALEGKWKGSPNWILLKDQIIGR